jgi:hypothetical protein
LCGFVGGEMIRGLRIAVYVILFLGLISSIVCTLIVVNMQNATLRAQMMLPSHTSTFEHSQQLADYFTHRALYPIPFPTAEDALAFHEFQWSTATGLAPTRAPQSVADTLSRYLPLLCRPGKRNTTGEIDKGHLMIQWPRLIDGERWCFTYRRFFEPGKDTIAVGTAVRATALLNHYLPLWWNEYESWTSYANGLQLILGGFPYGITFEPNDSTLAPITFVDLSDTLSFMGRPVDEKDAELLLIEKKAGLGIFGYVTIEAYGIADLGVDLLRKRVMLVAYVSWIVIATGLIALMLLKKKAQRQ